MRRAGSALAPTLITILASLAALVGSSGTIVSAARFLVAVCAGLMAAAALARPSKAAWVGLAVILVVPTYWATYLPLGRIPTFPGIVVPLVLLPAALRLLRREGIQLSSIDILVATYLALVVLSNFLHFRDPLPVSVYSLVHVGVPYLSFRLLSSPADAARRAAATVVVVGVLLAIVGLGERAGRENPFFNGPSGVGAAGWASAQERFGVIRAEASFGHSIPFGMFLAVAFVLALAILWRRRDWAPWAAAGLVVASALLATQSRGALVVLIVGLVLWLASLGRDLAPGRLVVAAFVGMSLLVLTPAGASIWDLRESVTASGEAQQSVEHRLTIVDVLRDPANFSLLGVDAGESDAAGVAGQRASVSTLDNEFGLLYLSRGFLTLLVFAAIGLRVTAATFSPGWLPVERAWAAGVAATFAGLSSVALVTQHVTFYWMAVAIVSAIMARHRLPGRGGAPRRYSEVLVSEPPQASPLSLPR